MSVIGAEWVAMCCLRTTRRGPQCGSLEGEGACGPPSGSAGPDQVAGAVLGLDHGGVDRGREARIVELDRGIGPALLRGLLPGGTELDVAGAGDNPEVGALVVVLLDRDEADLGVEGEGLDRAGEAVAGLGEGADDRHDCLSVRFISAAPSRPCWTASLGAIQSPGACG